MDTDDNDMDVYYHYTTLESAVAIVRSGVIKMSTKKAKRRDDARYGNGVYLTQVPPTTHPLLIAFNNYDGRSYQAIAAMIAKGERLLGIIYCTNVTGLNHAYSDINHNSKLNVTFTDK